MSQVNLLPPEILQGQKTRRTAAMVLAAGGAVVVLLFIFYLVQVQRLSSVEDEIAAQDSTNAALQAEITSLEKYEELEIRAQQKESLLGAAYAGEVSFSGLLMDVSTIMPTDAYLQSLGVTTQATAPVEGTEAATTGAFAGNMALAGEALGIDTVSELLGRMEQVTGWVNPWASAVSQVDPLSDSWSYAITVDLTDEVLTARGKGAVASGG